MKIRFWQATRVLGTSLVWGCAGSLPAQPLFSDSFTNTTLNLNWTWESPNPASSYQLTGNGVTIDASSSNGGSDLYSGTELNAPRLLQPVIPTSDWIIETAMAFSPGANYQGAGLLLAATNGVFTQQSQFNRIAERAYYPDGGGSVVRSAGSYASFSSDVCYLRVQKSGSVYAGWYSSDGANWTYNGTTTDTTSWPYLGLFVVRYPWDGSQVDSVATVTYFKATAVTAASGTNFVPVSLAPVVNAVNNRIANCPTGDMVLGGVPFHLLPATGNNAWDAGAGTTAGDSSLQTMNLPARIYGAKAVDLLINLSWGNTATTIPLTFSCSDGTTYSFTLTPGAEVRDWLNGTYIDALSDSVIAEEVFSGVTLNGSSLGARIDKQHIPLPSTFATQVLTNITLTDHGVTGNDDSSYSHSVGAQRAFVYGVTVSAPPVLLNLTRVNHSVLLSWNTNLVGFTLQSRTNLAAGSWLAVGDIPSVVDGRFQVTNRTELTPTLYYRLARD